MKSTNIRIDNSDYRKLVELKKKTHIPIIHLVKQIIEDYLKKQKEN